MSSQPFRLRVSRPFLTVYFIPVLPIGALHEYVKCAKCKRSFEPSILAQTIADGTHAGQLSTQPVFAEDLLRLIALNLIEDGHVTEAEIKLARRVFENMAKARISRNQLGAACSGADDSQLSILSFLRTVKKRRTHTEKLKLVQAMFATASAEGKISSGRMQALLHCCQILDIEESEVQRAVESTVQWLTGPKR